MKTPYAKAVRAFRLRYFLDAVLRNNGAIAAAAREIGANANLIGKVLRDAGISRAEIRGMLIERARLEAGLPPTRWEKKPVQSAAVATAAQEVA